MKSNKLKDFFSFSVTDSKQTVTSQNIIELISCPLKEMMCQVHFTAINKSLLESEHYHKAKDFEKSIDTLKGAFYKTSELMGHPCTKCTQLFRTRIIESLENIHNSLEKTASGIFGIKAYHSVYVKANNVLKEFQKFRTVINFPMNDSKERFLGNHLN